MVNWGPAAVQASAGRLNTVVRLLTSQDRSVIGARLTKQMSRFETVRAHCEKSQVRACLRPLDRDRSGSPLCCQSPLKGLAKALDVSVGDEAGGEAEEGFVDVVPPLPADA